MALKSTVFKVVAQIADMDRNYYQDHQLTVAQHPSETDERLMVRLLAFAMNSSPTLAFTKGLSSDEDEPELWDRDYSGVINRWIEFGQVDEKWLRKASGRARQVQLVCYGGRSVPVWWQQNQQQLARYKNLQVIEIPEQSVKAMGKLVSRAMTLQYTINEGQIWISDGSDSLLIEPVVLKDYS